MPRFFLSGLLGVLAAGLLGGFSSRAAATDAEVLWVSSAAEKPWQRMPAPAFTSADPEAPALIRVMPQKTRQTIEGFGGCFNELGWVALSKASEAEREAVLTALFGDEGCAFTLARLPIGASDFAQDAYSLDDTTGDLALKEFSIARDRQQLIPFVKAALAVRPGLRCWGSPWSPPAWMKDNQHYSKGSLKADPAILRAYADYFVRWIEAYRAEGIDIYAVSPQNEPNIASAYPSCLWTARQLREFIGDYLGPVLRDREAKVEVWLGLNGDPFHLGENSTYRLVTVLDDPRANAFIRAIGFQYDSKDQLSEARELYPDKKLIRTETECRSGKNSWADAQSLFQLMRQSLGSGANAYFQWNLVLDDTGMGPWKWRQNAPITVNRENGRVTYNGEYYVMRHFSRYVKPGAKRVLTTGPWGDRIAFINPDGSIVVIVGNSALKPMEIIISIAGRTEGDTIKVTLPPASVNTFAIPSRS